MLGEEVNILGFIGGIERTGIVTALAPCNQAKIGGKWITVNRLELSGSAIAERLSRTVVEQENKEPCRVVVKI